LSCFDVRRAGLCSSAPFTGQVYMPKVNRIHPTPPVWTHTRIGTSQRKTRRKERHTWPMDSKRGALSRSFLVSSHHAQPKRRRKEGGSQPPVPSGETRHIPTASKKALASDLGLASRVQDLGGGNISRTRISFDPESSVLAAKHCLPKAPM
jgi:hypothetical protein